jgi:hypothetical protein
MPGGPLREARADLDGEMALCWVGPTYETATAAMGFGSLMTGPESRDSRILRAYSFGNSGSLKVQAYDGSGALLRGCVVVDPWGDQQWVEVVFNHDTCRGAAYVLVTGHEDPNGDL